MTNNAQLLPLPEPDFQCGDCTIGEGGYTDEQMQSYALACIEAAKPADPSILMVELMKCRGEYIDAYRTLGSLMNVDSMTGDNAGKMNKEVERNHIAFRLDEIERALAMYKSEQSK